MRILNWNVSRGLALNMAGNDYVMKYLGQCITSPFCLRRNWSQDPLCIGRQAVGKTRWAATWLKVWQVGYTLKKEKCNVGASGFCCRTEETVHRNAKRASLFRAPKLQGSMQRINTSRCLSSAGLFIREQSNYRKSKSMLCYYCYRKIIPNTFIYSLLN